MTRPEGQQEIAVLAKRKRRSAENLAWKKLVNHPKEMKIVPVL